jgi:AraC-like DNA-binding protein
MEPAVMHDSCYTEAVSSPIAWYREFAPCAALQDDVYAFFSFVPTPRHRTHHLLLREVAFRDATFCSPQFADGHLSIVFELGRTCDTDGAWHDNRLAVRGTVIGPMTAVGRTEGSDRPEMIGVYFRPGRVNGFLHIALSDLTDRAIDIGDVWGASTRFLSGDLGNLDEAGRIERLEQILLRQRARDRRRAESMDVQGLAAHILRRRGRATVDAIAHAAGVSRQHLARQFRERIGVAPKLYIRLARFHAGLVHAGSRESVDWAVAAAEMGYADQSHMIAEFRRFSGLTPHALASRDWFHPFIERARSSWGNPNHRRP